MQYEAKCRQDLEAFNVKGKEVWHRILVDSGGFWGMTRPDGANICLFQRFFNTLVPRDSKIVPWKPHTY